MTTSRLESFSDGVIAVAITLLVLNLSVPRSGQLAARLGHAWPDYAAYAISFVTIGIIWINHHVMVGRLRTADHAILFLNLLLLMSIVLLPFTTELMAVYLRRTSGQHLAAAIYGGSLLVMGALFGAMNSHILLRKPHLLADSIPAGQRRLILTRSVGGLAPYVLAVALAPLSAYGTLGVCGAVAVFYALPFASGTS